jgi:hypothetical protein
MNSSPNFLANQDNQVKVGRENIQTLPDIFKIVQL